MAPEEYTKELMSTMKKFREESILCDTILKADDQELSAHSVVLAAVSPFLCSTFKELSIAATTKVQYRISLPGCCASAVELVLQFLYTGQLVAPSCYRQVEEFSRILLVCRSLGIDISKLNGAQVTFENGVESLNESQSSGDDKGENPSSEDQILEDDGCALGKSLMSSDNHVPNYGPLAIYNQPNEELPSLLPSLLSVSTPANTEKIPDSSLKLRDANVALLSVKENHSVRTSTRLAAKKYKVNHSCRKQEINSSPTKQQSRNESIETDVKNEAGDLKPPPTLHHKDLRDVLPHSFNENSGERSGYSGEGVTAVRNIFTCQTCRKEFRRERCLDKHMQLHDRQTDTRVCDKCGRILSSVAALRVHQKSHVDGFPHVCEHCGKGYKFKRYFLIHAMKHKGTKPFLCDTCGRGFYVVTNLRRHVLNWHTTVRPYVCSLCGKGFVTRPRLAKHQETHSGERPYSCETCGSTFANAGNLSRHRALHTGEKPYVCPVCMRGFAQKVTMQNHLLTHSDQRAAFVCPVCGKCLSKRSNLTKHLLVHSRQRPHVCERCGKCFSVKEYLVRHLAVHADKNHVCSACGKGFSSRRVLALHARTHTTQSCNRCGKEFVGPQALSTHMRVHLVEAKL